MLALNESIDELKKGKLVTKTIEELETMEQYMPNIKFTEKAWEEYFHWKLAGILFS